MLRTVIGVLLVALTASGCEQQESQSAKDNTACMHLGNYPTSHILLANTPISPGDRLDLCGSEEHALARITESGNERLGIKNGLSLVVIASRENSVVAQFIPGDRPAKTGERQTAYYVLIKKSDAQAWRREADYNDGVAAEKMRHENYSREEAEWAKDVVRNSAISKK